MHTRSSKRRDTLSDTSSRGTKRKKTETSAETASEISKKPKIIRFKLGSFDQDMELLGSSHLFSVKCDKGKRAWKPLNGEELKDFTERNKNKPFYSRIQDFFDKHASAETFTDTKNTIFIDEQGEKKHAVFEYETKIFTQYHRHTDANGTNHLITITLMPTILFKTQRFLYDEECTSWIDLTNEAHMQFDFRAYCKGKLIARDSGQKNHHDEWAMAEIKEELKENSAEELIALYEKEIQELKSSLPEFKESKPDERMALEELTRGELHTIKATKAITGTEVVKFTQKFYGLFNRGITALVDDSKFEDKKDTYHIPLRLIFPIVYNKTFYQRIDPTVSLIEGELDTAFNGRVDQNVERRNEKLKILCNITLKEWHEGLQEQAADAILLRGKLLIDMKENAGLAAFISECKMSDEMLLASPLLLTRLEQSKVDNDKLNSLHDRVINYRLYAQGILYPELLMSLDGFRGQAGRQDERKPTPFLSRTIKDLTIEIFEASKKAGRTPSRDLITLSTLLCDGIVVKGDGGYVKTIDPSKKITKLRECVHELLWKSYLWQINSAPPSLRAKAI